MEEFLLTFPVFVIADAEDTPMSITGSDGRECLALFTDMSLAEAMLNRLGADLCLEGPITLKIHEIHSASKLAGFIDSFDPPFTHIAFDASPNPRHRRLVVPTEDILRQLRQADF